ncbi:MAG: hypothetical protein ACRBCJ_13860 [Hyphomicrobiaceae bacterium]
MRLFGHVFTAVAALVTGLGLAVSASAADPSTVRIETRPYYGAVVTIEAGVRVFRALPRTSKVIINPEGRTPLALSFNETRVYERRVNQNNNYIRYYRGARYPRSVGVYGGRVYGGYRAH